MAAAAAAAVYRQRARFDTMMSSPPAMSAAIEVHATFASTNPYGETQPILDLT